LGIYESKLRLFTAEGQLIPTPEEAAQQAEQQVQQAEQQVQQAEQQVAQMEAMLARYRERFGELPE
jgi:phage shock protein A